MTRDLVKRILGITETTYDDRIDLAIPALVEQICISCKNYFYAKNTNGYIYETLDMDLAGDTATCDFTLPFEAENFIVISGTAYNDGLYRIGSILDDNSGFVIENYKKFVEEEAIEATIFLCKIPFELVNLIAQHINSSIVLNNSNIQKKKIDDVEITYFKQENTKSLDFSDEYVKGVLKNYKKFYWEEI